MGYMKTPRLRRLLIGFTALATAAGCANSQPADTEPSAAAVPVITPVVLAEIPHDTTAFTQGLEFDGPTLYESTGRVGKSQLRELDPDTGVVRRFAPAPARYFGEGITVVDDTIWELTWRDGVAIAWDKNTFTPLREVPVDGEGWGLCRDGARLIRSDGTNRLRFHDPHSFAETGSVEVTKDGQPVRNLNELECVDGRVWANIWQTNTIVRIDPETGAVDTTVDASAIADGRGQGNEDVLNGIAHIEGQDFLLTGKNWPTMYRVRIDAPS